MHHIAQLNLTNINKPVQNLTLTALLKKITKLKISKKKQTHLSPRNITTSPHPQQGNTQTDRTTLSSWQPCTQWHPRPAADPAHRRTNRPINDELPLKTDQ